jgi:predicted RNA-binding Zn ribbon-like protein
MEMATEVDSAHAGHDRFAFRGGQLALDFVNTVGSWRDPERPGRYLPRNEYLMNYADLLAWSEKAGTLSEAEAAALRARSEHQAAEAEAMRARAIAFRNALHAILTARLHGRTPEAADLAVVNDEVLSLLATSRLVPTDGAFTLAPEPADDAAFDRPLLPVVRAALDLLTDPADVARVRECPKADCGWMFLDTSGGRRRWCSMADCGNAEKVKRFRQRHRTS